MSFVYIVLYDNQLCRKVLGPVLRSRVLSPVLRTEIVMYNGKMALHVYRLIFEAVFQGSTSIILYIVYCTCAVKCKHDMANS